MQAARSQQLEDRNRFLSSTAGVDTLTGALGEGREQAGRQAGVEWGTDVEVVAGEVDVAGELSQPCSTQHRPTMTMPDATSRQLAHLQRLASKTPEPSGPIWARQRRRRSRGVGRASPRPRRRL